MILSQDGQNLLQSKFPSKFLGAIMLLNLCMDPLMAQPENHRPSSESTTLSGFKSRTNMPMVCRCLGETNLGQTNMNQPNKLNKFPSP